MGYLIILRGPKGSGKSSISECLIERLGSDTYRLDIDTTNEQEHLFEQHLREALSKQYVIGEIYSGKLHTSEPERWIMKFKDKDYTMLSVILHTSLEECTKRVRIRDQDKADSDVQIESFFNNFYQRLQTIFAIKANIDETCINTERYGEQETTEKILRHLGLMK
ncbi:MAG: AAA family ATPase [Candidatus Nitrosopolaris sp.]